MLTDVIAALATPTGQSAIALVRMSGTGAHDVAARVLHPFATAPFRNARRARVSSHQSGEIIDDVLYVTFEGPSSYTGEDVVEISTHGGLHVPLEVLECLLEAGARLALPGEFTRRAVLNGKLDLLQAEAVGDLIAASSSAQRRTALNQLDKGLTRRIEGLRQDALQLEKLICYEIDFPEEDSGPVPEHEVQRAIQNFRVVCRTLLATATEGERIRDGAVVVIAGLPNSGKSSLFNALLGVDRAIVTEIAGTTRDAIEAPLSCAGFPVRLVDTAGLRQTDDLIESKGIEVSQRYVDGADVILFCAEAGRDLTVSERHFLDSCRQPVILVRTKCDLVDEANEKTLLVSAVSGAGIEDLRGALAESAFSGMVTSPSVEPVLTRARHRTALERSLGEIDLFENARKTGVEGAVAAVHLRAAVHELEGMIGVIQTEDVLDAVFSSFCIGK